MTETAKEVVKDVVKDVAKDVAKGETKPCCQKKVSKMVKTSELPLYGNPYPRCDNVLSQELGYIESGVKTVREEVTPYLGVFSSAGKRAKEIMITSYEHSKSTYEYISSEGNTVPKAMAITGGGLLGLIIASRKGFFKKLLYTGAGLSIASAACYPKEFNELSEIGLLIVKTKGPELIKQYTGVDLSRKKGANDSPKGIDQIGQEVSDVSYFGFRLSETPSASQSAPNASAVEKPTAGVKGDFGMSKKEDKDLYANRSTK